MRRDEKIIDESGEDYLLAMERFVVLTLPARDAHTVVQAMKRQRDGSD